MESALTSIFISLSRYFSQQKVTFAEEIELVVEEELSKLSPETKEKLERWLEGDLEQAIFESIVREPISVYSPDMTAKRNYLGETFYHSRHHLYPIEDLEQAFKRLVEIRAPSLLSKMERVTNSFLDKSGYKLSSCMTYEEPIKHKRITATKSEYNLLIFIIPSIVFAPEYPLSEEGVEQVIVVPSERTPAPFVHFLRSRLKNFEDRGIQIWVVDLKGEVITPFLGYPKDKDIVENFENPEQALLAAQFLKQHKLPWMTEED